MSNANLFAALAPAIKLVEDGATFTFHPIDEATGEIDLTNIAEDLTNALRALKLPIPTNFNVKSITFETK